MYVIRKISFLITKIKTCKENSKTFTRCLLCVKKIEISLHEQNNCNMETWQLLPLPYRDDLESKKILKKLSSANRALAELKGIAQSIPQQSVLINTLSMQEAKDSSEVENIVTTHDEIYKSALSDSNLSPASKEVKNYIEALKKAFDLVKQKQIITINDIIAVQQILEKNNAGFRKVPGTNLKNQKTGEVIYEPPQNADDIKNLMGNLVDFINDDTLSDYDPILKMAIIHFQFESIHPFYDGNGRTGRILNIAYLVLKGLLDIPVLYLSRYVIQNKEAYYKNIQAVRDENAWEYWLLFMLDGVEQTAYNAIEVIKRIKYSMGIMKKQLKDNYKFYSHDLINHLFKHPYTKIEFLKNELGISRVTAGSYLNQLAEGGILEKIRHGKSNYYVNKELVDILIN